jgi:uncharacterized membrane protein YraQ (UPF0718 family)
MNGFLQQFAWDLWVTVVEMAPYLLLGFGVAGVMSVWISPAMVERHLGGRGLLPILKASAFGVPLPLCSCGVIPVSMSLRKHGASKGATIAFLLSTPQTGVDSILVTYSLLGPVFTVLRPLIALVTGVIGGALVDEFDPGKTEAAAPEETKAPACCPNCKTSKWVKALRYGFISLPKDIGRPMLLGLLVAAGISAAIPKDFFAPVLGGGIVAMLVMAAVGVPMYVCATASVPIAAALIAKGVSPGAALVFLMTGPATNAASLLTIWSQLGHRTAWLYLLTVVGSAIGCGLAIDAFMPGLGSDISAHFCENTPGLFGHGSAIVLLAVLGAAFLRKPK